jgi:hypothetical protein
VTVPSNHGRPLDDALRRLDAVELRVTFPSVSTPCGVGLPHVVLQSPRAPARVERGTVVAVKFQSSPIPSPDVPTRRPRWTYTPDLVGEEATAAYRLRAIWPCLHVRAASGVAASRLVVVAQRPPPHTRVPAYGVSIGRGWRPTTMDVYVAAR